jgi:trans-aconitate methyltransferase
LKREIVTDGQTQTITETVTVKQKYSHKTYSTLSARRFASDMRDALAKVYVSKAPSFNSVFDYLQMESLTPYLKQLIAESAIAPPVD